MEEVTPNEVIRDVQSYNEKRSDRAKDTLDYFLEKQGALMKRLEVIDALTKEYGWSEEVANISISDLVGDLVDPVQQIVHPQHGKLVGIIEYNEYPYSGAYGYIDYDDVKGRRKRVVCSQCVEQAESDAEVSHATEGEGSASEDATWDDLCETVVAHYEVSHDVEPFEVTVGASLASGTTISGNTSFHAGNDGVGSGLDADTLNGSEPSGIPVDNFDGSNGAAGEALQTDGSNLSFASIGGNVPDYEHVGGSPFNGITKSSFTVDFSESYRNILIKERADPSVNRGFTGLQINGVTAEDYQQRELGGSEFTDTEIGIGNDYGRAGIHINAGNFSIQYGLVHTTPSATPVLGGELFGQEGSINQVTFKSGPTRDGGTNIRIYNLPF